MLLSLLTFTVIFTIFGFIIFTQVQHTLFSETDKDLARYQEKVNANPAWKTRKSSDSDGYHRRNPRVIRINWSDNGEILNPEQIGTHLYEDHFINYTADLSKLNTVTNITIDGEYKFRYLLFKDQNPDDEIAFNQLFINIDAEQTIIENFRKLMIVCILIFIILSISASYFLSKKMMKPIIQSWDKHNQFVEDASHELRTPLTIIQNKLELLLMAPQEKIIDKFEYIALSLSETRRLSRLTSDLLTLARADSNETKFTKQPININDFIKTVSLPYIEIAESQDKHFWLNLNCDITLQADKVRLHQLLVILFDNALKYTNESDSIGVKAYADEQKVIIEVIDTGHGIKEENIQFIFDRFYREDKSRSRETGGSGLGLSIAQWIVATHSGTISAIKNHTEGTTFKVKLPH